MKSTFSIRRLEPSDTDQLRALLATRDDIDEQATKQRVAIVEWTAFKNPHADGEATYFVAEQDGMLIAHIGRMPSFFSLEGSRVKGYFVHDLYVHPDHRADGKGLSLSVALYRATWEQSDSFCALLWTTKLNLEIQRRLGYKEGKVDNYIKVLRAEPIARRRFSAELVVKAFCFVPNLFLSAFDAVRVRLGRRLAQVVPVEQFDQRFDDLNNRISPRLGIHSVKSARILNWRYAERPFHTNQIFAAVRGDEVVGFIVVNTRRDPLALSGVIVDLMADPDDENTISALMAEAVRCCRRNGAEVIQCIMTQSEFAAILPRYLFFQKADWRQPLMMGNLEKCPAYESVLPDSKNWHMTKGESDGFMFL